MPTPAGLPIATRADSSSIAADATTIFRPDYSLSLREPEHHPPPLLSVSPGSNSTGRRSEHPAMRMSSSPRPDGASSQASSRGQSQQGQHPLSRSRSGSPSSFANCMESGLSLLCLRADENRRSSAREVLTDTAPFRTQGRAASPLRGGALRIGSHVPARLDLGSAAACWGTTASVGALSLR